MKRVQTGDVIVADGMMTSARLQARRGDQLMKPIPRRPPTPVTIENVREALLVAAQLVDIYGEIALPLFEQMEADYHDMLRRGAAIERARAIARRGSVD